MSLCRSTRPNGKGSSASCSSTVRLGISKRRTRSGVMRRAEREAETEIQAVFLTVCVGQAESVAHGAEPQTTTLARVPIAVRVALVPDPARIVKANKTQVAAREQLDARDGQVQLRAAIRSRVAGKAIPAVAAQGFRRADECGFMQREV